MSPAPELGKCDPGNPLLICVGRAEAMRAGDRGRYFNDGPLPAMLLTEICPFCGGGLPSLRAEDTDCN